MSTILRVPTIFAAIDSLQRWTMPVTPREELAFRGKQIRPVRLVDAIPTHG